MSKARLALVGWRGMVGSVLLERMRAENDFSKFLVSFFSSSNAGSLVSGHIRGLGTDKLLDSTNIDELKNFDIIVSCQGSEYTQDIHTKLRTSSWSGYWIDAASFLRNKPTATLILDPVNRTQIEQALEAGSKDFIGVNCTTAILLLGLKSLLAAQKLKWVSFSSYQAISGAGAAALHELLEQYAFINNELATALSKPQNSALYLEQNFRSLQAHKDFPQQHLAYPLAGNILPWIDSSLPDGRSKEEWKSSFESDKILDKRAIPIDGSCVRVPVFRSHSLSIQFQVNSPVRREELEDDLRNSHQWLRYVPNTLEATKERLNPIATSASLEIRVGRLRQLHTQENCWSLFLIGDQLLWGAAEPLRRMLGIIQERL